MTKLGKYYNNLVINFLIFLNCCYINKVLQQFGYKCAKISMKHEKLTENTLRNQSIL